jgi:Spy/CpxP family protein refolding chaperone
MTRKALALVLGALLALAAVGAVSAEGNNGPPPCQGQGFNGCSGPGGS